MAKSFQLNAELFLQVSNLSQVAESLQKTLNKVAGNINIKIDAKSQGSVNTLNKSIVDLNNNLNRTVSSAASAEAAIANLSTTFARFNLGVRSGAKDTAESLRELSTGMSNVQRNTNTTNRAITQLSRPLRNLRTNVNDTSSEFEAFGRLAALSLRRFAAFTLATGSVFGLVFAIKNGISEFIDFEKEVVRLEQVSGRTKETLKGLTNEITRLSVALGIPSKELTQAATTFAQAGFTIDETKEALEAVAKAARLPSFGDTEDTVQALIATFQQFKIGTDSFKEALGSANAVAAAFAVEAEDITTAVRKGGSVFAAAANVRDAESGKKAFKEFIALFTSVRQTTRLSADQIATGFNTIFARIQRPDTIKFLKQFGIELRDLQGNFVGGFEAFQRLGKALNNIDPRSDVFARIVEEVGGIRQLKNVLPAIQQTAVATKALGVANQGAFDFDEQAAKGLESFAAKIGQVREEFKAFLRDVGESTTFKVIANGILQITSALIKLADAVKPVLPALAILAAIKATKIGAEFGRGFLNFRQGFGTPETAGPSFRAGGFLGGLFGRKAQATTGVAATEHAQLGEINLSDRSIERIFLRERQISNQLQTSLGQSVPIHSLENTIINPRHAARDRATGRFISGDTLIENALNTPRQFPRGVIGRGIPTVQTAQNLNFNQLDLRSVFGEQFLKTGSAEQFDIFRKSVGKKALLGGGALGASPEELLQDFRKAAKVLIPLSESEAKLTHATDAYLAERRLGLNHAQALGVAEATLLRGTKDLNFATKTLTEERVKEALASKQSLRQRLGTGLGNLKDVLTQGPLFQPVDVKGLLGKGASFLRGGGAALGGLLLGGFLEDRATTAGSRGGAGTLGGTGGALTGAVTGGLIGGPLGAAIGGVIGGLQGFNKALNDFDQKKVLDALAESGKSLDEVFRNLTNATQESINQALGARVGAAQTFANKSINDLKPGNFFGLFGPTNSIGGNIGQGLFNLLTGNKAGTVNLQKPFTVATRIQAGKELSTNFKDDAQKILADIGEKGARGVKSKFLESDSALQTLAISTQKGAELFVKLNHELNTGKITLAQYQEGLKNLNSIGLEVAQETIDIAAKQFKLNQAFRDALPPLDLLIQKFTALSEASKFISGNIGIAEAKTASRTSFATGTAQTILPGQFATVNAARNLNAAPNAAIEEALRQATGLIGTKLGTPLSNAVKDLRRVDTELPKILNEARNKTGLEGNAQGFISSQIRERFGNNPELVRALETGINKAFEGVNKEGDLSVVEKLLDSGELSSIAKNLSKAAEDALNSVLGTYQESVQSFIKATNEASALQVKSVRSFEEANKVLSESGFEQRRLRGQEVSVGDVRAQQTARFGALSGGLSFGPNLEKQLNVLLTRKTGLENEIQNTTAPNELALLGDLLKNVNAQLEGTKVALEELASSTEVANTIREKLNNLERVRAGANNLAEALATGDINDLQKILKQQLLARQALGGQQLGSAQERQQALAGVKQLQDLTPTQEDREKLQRQFLNSQLRGLGQNNALGLALQERGATPQEAGLLAELQKANEQQAEARKVLGRIEQQGANQIKNGADAQLQDTLKDLKAAAKSIIDTFGPSKENNNFGKVSANFGQSVDRLASTLEKVNVPETITFKGDLNTKVAVVGGGGVGDAIVREVVPQIEVLIDQRVRRNINGLDGSTRGNA